MNPLRRAVNKVREINQKYSKPRFHLSTTTRAVLLGLRIYLIILVILLVYKFATLL